MWYRIRLTASSGPFDSAQYFEDVEASPSAASRTTRRPVGVAALSGPVDPERLDAGSMRCGSSATSRCEASNLRRRDGLFAGDDDTRLAAFHELARATTWRPSSSRAAAGACCGPAADRLGSAAAPAAGLRRLLRPDAVSPAGRRTRRRGGLSRTHGRRRPGPRSGRSGGCEHRRSARRTVSGAGGVHERFGVSETLDGPVDGVLLGGCLSVLVSTLGTPWAADLDGALL